MNTATQAVANATTTARLCGCGCEAEVGKRSIFRPGHDARLVSKAIASSVGLYNNETAQAPSWVYDDPNIDIHDRITKTAALFALHFTEALASKYQDAAFRAWEKSANTAGPTVGPTVRKAKAKSLVGQPAWVKIGRWFYNGEVASITVDGNGNETAGSEVCYIAYEGTNGQLGAQVDSSTMTGKWGFGHVDRKTGAPLA